MIIAYIPFLFALAGLIMWLVSSNKKVQDIGAILFICGWFVTMWTLASRTLRIG